MIKYDEYPDMIKEKISLELYNEVYSKCKFGNDNFNSHDVKLFEYANDDFLSEKVTYFCSTCKILHYTQHVNDKYCVDCKEEFEFIDYVPLKIEQTIICSECNKESGQKFWIEIPRTQADLDYPPDKYYCFDCHNKIIEKFNNNKFLSCGNYTYRGQGFYSSKEEREKLMINFMEEINNVGDKHYLLDIKKNNKNEIIVIIVIPEYLFTPALEFEELIEYFSLLYIKNSEGQFMKKK